MADEYIDFYDNMYWIRRKSVYHRRYHIQNKIDDISIKNGIQITFRNKAKIYLIFEEIDVKGTRKRMININFILKQLFKMLNLPYENIQISKSKRTLNSYVVYWNEILSLIGDRIRNII